jgi:hypothetical protein
VGVEDLDDVAANRDERRDRGEVSGANDAE